jgi:glucose/arabinose dehydrogenase
MPRHPLRLSAVAAAALLAACTDGGGSSQGTASSPPSGAPGLEVTVLADGLDHAWDVVQAPDDTLLVSERPGGLTAVRAGGGQQAVAADLSDLFADGETGFMGLALDPGFADNRRFYSCQGKVLRVDPASGEGLPDNPFADSDDPATRRIFTFGHRNVQGLALRPDSNQLYSVEHGPDRDDEVNRLQPGANYGWDPATGGDGYDESVPMTDEDIEGAVPAVWSSGSPTLATSGAAFVEGSSWGEYDGALLIGLLKDTGVLALRLDDQGAVVEQFRVPELDDEYGRIREVRQGRDGALYVTTDNGGDDRLLRVTPR